MVGPHDVVAEGPVASDVASSPKVTISVPDDVFTEGAKGTPVSDSPMKGPVFVDVAAESIEHASVLLSHGQSSKKSYPVPKKLVSSSMAKSTSSKIHTVNSFCILEN